MDGLPAQIFAEAKRPAATRSEDAPLRIRTALIDSVRHHLVADVPVGIFLSRVSIPERSLA